MSTRRKGLRGPSLSSRARHLAFGLSFSLLATIGCQPSQADTVRATRAQSLAAELLDAVSNSKTGDRLIMAEVLSGDWSRFAVFPAYSSNEAAHQTLGFPFDIERTPSQSDDSIDVIVLATDVAVVQWFTVSESEVSFGVDSTPLTLDKSDSVFEVSITSLGDRILTPISTT